MTDITVIDKDFNFKASLDNCKSINFPRSLYDITEFQINTSAAAGKELLPGRIVYLDSRRAGIIRTLDIDESKNGDEVIARGIELKGIVNQRRVVPDRIADSQFFGWDRYPGLDDPDAPAESVIKHYVDRHMVNPDDPNRKFPRLVIAPDLGRGHLMRWQSRWDPLDAVLKSIGEYSGIGYEIWLDFDNDQFVFDIIFGRDKTSSSDSPVLFATGWGNTSKTKYTVDEKDWRNVGYAGGAGEDEGRLIQTVFEGDTAPSGFDRREDWLDCGNVEHVDDLRYEGKYKLQEKKRRESLTGAVIPAGPFQYLRDWEIGDRVTVASETAGVESDMQITGVDEGYEQGKTSIKPIFGTRKKTFIDEIRKTGVVK